MKLSKTIKPYIIIALLAIIFVLGFSNCSQTNIPDDNPNYQRIGIHVSDAGYASSVNRSGNFGLQSGNTGYHTVFTAGDRIGVYAVKGGVIVDGIENYPLTTVINGTDTTWQADPGKLPLTLTPDVTYYAYYPYQAAPEIKPKLDATEAIDFFADLIKGWNTSDDQSQYKNYSASDLMVSKGVVTDGNLTFTMDHQMALAILNFQPTSSHYVFDNQVTAPTQPLKDYIVKAPPVPVFESHIKPWHSADYRYRYLLNPLNSSLLTDGSIYGKYLFGKISWESRFSDMPSLKPGQYFIFNIGKMSDTPLTLHYTLKRGDYYLKDGSLLHNDFKLDVVFKDAVRAVVIKVGRDISGDYADNETYYHKNGSITLPLIHGYAVALFDAKNGERSQWDPIPSETAFVNTHQYQAGETAFREFWGYEDTRKIRDAGENDLQKKYPACYWATDDYEKTYPSPPEAQVACSGWFLPSAGQLKYAYTNRADYESSFQQAEGQIWNTKSYYWSTSEVTNQASYAWNVDFASPHVYTGLKTSWYFVRPFIVF